MKTINIPETRVGRFSETKIGLNITLELKEEDASDIRLALREFYKDGTLLAGAFTVIEREPETDVGGGKPISKALWLRKLLIDFGGDIEYATFKSDMGVEHLRDLPEDILDFHTIDYEQKLGIVSP